MGCGGGGGGGGGDGYGCRVLCFMFLGLEWGKRGWNGLGAGWEFVRRRLGVGGK